MVFEKKVKLRNFNICNNDDVYFVHNRINKLFSEENKVPGTLFEARSSPNI